MHTANVSNAPASVNWYCVHLDEKADHPRWRLTASTMLVAWECARLRYPFNRIRRVEWLGSVSDRA